MDEPGSRAPDERALRGDRTDAPTVPLDDPARPAPAPAPAVAPTGSSEALDPLIGTRLADRYLVVRRIGEGGMGAVYEARHTVLDKRVAVKVLLEKLLGKTELVARLLQEARLASAIGHENIVDVVDFGTTADGRSFVVMEYLDGESLASLLAREAPLPVERALRLARQVASALDAAHRKGIVHRDVKPENVYLVRRGADDFVKVVDFGVSKAARSAEDGVEMLRLTRTGMLLGTPLYMSPEQARGDDDVDGRADVWAVGVLLYECLTAEVPFRANNYLGVISQVLTNEVVPPSRLRPELEIPGAVEAIVLRALQKDRARRYQTMDALEGDLGRLLAGDPNVGLDTTAVEATAPDRVTVRPRWHLLVAGSVLVLIAVGLAVGSPLQPAPKPAARVAARTAQPVVAAPVAATPTQAVLPPPQQAASPSVHRASRPTSKRARRQEAGPAQVERRGDDIVPSADKAYGPARP